ncbi:MAG: rod shape-determining protein MreC [Flavobacteriaceae bacterium]|jgi:rod shape-determining protein MreC|nr:rod shape-determining protein MreC [Flavobacteriaceae bacterium]
MALLLDFMQKNSRLLLFLFLEIIAIIFTFNKNMYHNSLIESTVIAFSGAVNEKNASITDYFHLKKENERLLAENLQYRNRFLGKEQKLKPEFAQVTDSAQYRQKYYYMEADVVSNSVTKPDNYLIINKGTAQGVGAEMGVVSPVGIVGIVLNSTKNYSKVMSVLNRNIKISARMKLSKYFGTLTWDGEDSRIMQLSDIPKYVGVKVGDTIETYAKSEVFPEGVLIGRVSGKSLDAESSNWVVSVELFQDMANVQNVYVINGLDKMELKTLQKDTINYAK